VEAQIYADRLIERLRNAGLEISHGET